MNDRDYSSYLYFDRRTNEEDMPVRPTQEIQKKYEDIEALFEEFFCLLGKLRELHSANPLPLGRYIFSLKTFSYLVSTYLALLSLSLCIRPYMFSLLPSRSRFLVNSKISLSHTPLFTS